MIMIELWGECAKEIIIYVGQTLARRLLSYHVFIQDMFTFLSSAPCQ